MKQRVCTVYGLRSTEDCVIRYVGQTMQPASHRLGNHVAKARRGHRGHRSNWIRSVEKLGHRVEIVVLQSPAVWNESEIEWISRLLGRGLPLVNKTRGGDAHRGLLVPDERRERIAASVRRLWSGPEYRARMRAARAARGYWTEERRAEQAERARRQGPPTQEARSKLGSSLKAGRYADPAQRQRQAERLKALRADARTNGRRIAAMRDALRTDAYRGAQSARIKEIWRKRHAGELPMPVHSSIACS